MENDDFKVDFIGIATQKAATTWTFQCLKEHPEICGSSTKEVAFFNNDYEYKKGIQAYRKYFSNCSRGKIIGEYTPGYFWHKKAAERIYKHFPDVKLIISLRDPLERAYSHYQSNLQKSGVMTEYDDFEEALEQSRFLVEESLYYKNLKKFYDLFPKENIHVILFEEIKESPEQVIKSLYEFLGVKNNKFVPSSLKKKVNKTGNIQVRNRIPVLTKLIYKIRNYIRPSVNEQTFFFSLLKKLGLIKLVKVLLSFNRTKKQVENEVSMNIKLDLEVKEKALGLFEEDIKKLENLINEDLSYWKNGK